MRRNERKANSLERKTILPMPTSLHLLLLINLAFLLTLLVQITQALVLHIILDVVLLVWLPLIALRIFHR